MESAASATVSVASSTASAASCTSSEIASAVDSVIGCSSSASKLRLLFSDDTKLSPSFENLCDDRALEIEDVKK